MDCPAGFSCLYGNRASSRRNRRAAAVGRAALTCASGQGGLLRISRFKDARDIVK